MRNKEIAHILRLIGEYLVIEDGKTSFKTRAYGRAADIIDDYGKEMSAVYKEGGKSALKKISGIGEAISQKIEELVTTGKLEFFEELKVRIPIDLESLTAVDSLGPKRIAVLYQELGVKNLEDLESVAKKGKIAALEGFGEKSQEKILKSIAFVEKTNKRRLLGEIQPFLQELEDRCNAHPAVTNAVIAGSARRGKETIGDIDIIVTSKKPKEVMDFVCSWEEVGHIYGSGETKTMVRLKDGLDVDVRVVPKESFGAALQYFTGSKDHNVAVRERAREKGYTLNEYGLSKGTAKEKGKRIAGKTEKEIYEAVGLSYIPPELRENTGEIELSEKGKLPRLISHGSLKGDLQIQTTWTDGKGSIEEIARAAYMRGLEYIAITDHTKSLIVAGGLDEQGVRKQGKEIDRLNAVFKKEKINFTILKGTECDIKKDGTLDLSDATLATLDVVGISVHSHFGLSREAQTARIVRAMQNSHADILFHPTGRKIGMREPYDVDMEELIRIAKETKTVLEANAMPRRSDLRPEHIRKAVEAGVKLAISTDSHRIEHLDFLAYGVTQARRGMAKKSDVINTRPVKKMLSSLK